MNSAPIVMMDRKVLPTYLLSPAVPWPGCLTCVQRNLGEIYQI